MNEFKGTRVEIISPNSISDTGFIVAEYFGSRLFLAQFSLASLRLRTGYSPVCQRYFRFLQMDRHHAVPSNGGASRVPVFRRASSESQVPDQHSAPQKHDVHLEYAQEGRTDASVSAYSAISVGCNIDRRYRFGIRVSPK